MKGLEQAIETLDQVRQKEWEFFFSEYRFNTNVLGRFLTVKQAEYLRKQRAPLDPHHEVIKSKLRRISIKARSLELSIEDVKTIVENVLSFVKKHHHRDDFHHVNLFFGHTALDLLLSVKPLPEGAHSELNEAKFKLWKMYPKKSKGSADS